MKLLVRTVVLTIAYKAKPEDPGSNPSASISFFFSLFMQISNRRRTSRRAKRKCEAQIYYFFELFD